MLKGINPIKRDGNGFMPLTLWNCLISNWVPKQALIEYIESVFTLPPLGSFIWTSLIMSYNYPVKAGWKDYMHVFRKINLTRQLLETS